MSRSTGPDVTTPIELTVHVDPAGLQQAFAGQVELITRVVKIALGAAVPDVSAAHAFDGTQMSYGFHSEPGWRQDQLEAAYRRWVLASGFEDLLDLTSLFLERIRHVAGGLVLLERQNLSGPLAHEQVHHETTAVARAFQKASLRKKLERLAQSYRVIISPDAQDCLLSLNAARNCLVHRAGVVSLVDLKDRKALELRWLRLALMLRDHAGEREAVMGEVVGPCEYYCKLAVASKAFLPGQVLTLSPSEFADVAWSFVLTSLDVVQALERRAKDAGLQFADTNAI